MAFHLRVAATLLPLVEELAHELSRPLADPFATEVVAVPGDGVRAWLTERLAARLGATGGSAPDGVLANVEFIFPASLVRRALATPSGQSAWDVGPLTWAIHQVLTERGVELLSDGAVHRAAEGVDAVRCRAIADLFDRYALHRPEMVQRWERGADVDHLGRALDPHLSWQPRLWRALVELLGSDGSPGELARAAEMLRTGGVTPDLPERVFLVGLASLPPLHLTVLAALSQQIDVHVFTPTWSPAVWSRLVEAPAPVSLTTPIDRAADVTATAVLHPLGASWGRAAREAQVNLVRAARTAGVELGSAESAEPPDSPLETSDSTESSDHCLLHAVQRALRDDQPPPGAIASGDDQRLTLDVADHSIQWHRCHGPARQAEVLRDAVLHLLEETDEHGRPRFEPRDIAVLCADPVSYAPLIEAVFAGDEQHGVPAIPIRVADRSLRRDAPLLDAVGALLALLEQRFRASDVLAFASLEPVARRFGLGADALEQITEWVRTTNVRWGLDAAGRARFGIPGAIRPHSWQAGIEQLAVGAALADPELCPAGLHVELGPDQTVPIGGLEGDDVEVFGALADLVDQLHRAASRLAGSHTVDAWGQVVAESVGALCALDDADSWQWQQLDRLMAAFVGEAVVAGTPSSLPVPSEQLVVLLSARLTGRPGRVRFGTGAVTMSSLTAQRGVPHRVICLVGLDGELGLATSRSEDLTAQFPCVGDRDGRDEVRAQLLDAVLAAGERLVITSTGRDLRTNAPVPPAVPLAELADLLDATARTADPALRASDAIAVDHPRHSWSPRCFQPRTLGVDGPWSFDGGALEAARHRLAGSGRRSVATTRLPDEDPRPLTISEIDVSLRNPVESLLAGRLGVRLPAADRSIDALIPLTLGGLDRYQLHESLLATLRSGELPADQRVPAWSERQRLSGAIAPLEFGDGQLATAVDEVQALLEKVAGVAPGVQLTAAEELPVEVRVGPDLLTGSVGGVIDQTLVEIRVGQMKAAHRLQTWFHLLTLGLAMPDRPWRAVIVGLDRNRSPTADQMTLRSAASAATALGTLVDLHARARRCVVPALPDTTWAIYDGGRWKGAETWDRYHGFGDGADRWVRLVLGQLDYVDLLDIAPDDDESGPGWTDAPSRVERWADRLWGTVDASVEWERGL